MMFDRLQTFFYEKNVATTASSTTNGHILDFRLDGQDVDGNLAIVVIAEGAAPDKPVTTTLRTSDDGTAWTDLATQTVTGNNVLFKGRMPAEGRKRYLTMTVTVGETALAKALKVTGGIVCGDVDYDGPVALQEFDWDEKDGGGRPVDLAEGSKVTGATSGTQLR